MLDMCFHDCDENLVTTGEDLRKEQIEENAEIHLLQTEKDSKKRPQNSKNIIGVFVFFMLLLSGIGGVFFTGRCIYRKIISKQYRHREKT